MGPYLAQPITEKHINRGESQKTKLRYSFAEMQGTEYNDHRLEKKYGRCCHP